MKAKRLIVLTLAVAVFFAVLPALAKADSQMHVFPDGHYAITKVSTSATNTVATSSSRRMSSGWDGTATSSGSTDAWVTTTVYSIVGIKVYAVKSGVHYSWGNGIVKTHTRYEPTLKVDFRIPATSCTMTRNWGQQWPFTWNGKAYGGWYTSVIMHVKQAIMKYGIYGNMDIFHEYKLQGNGRFWWKATM